MRKPLNWPRYVTERRLADGSIAYYWHPHKRYGRGCEPLGKNYAEAVERASVLNEQLDAKRKGEPVFDQRYGTLDWLSDVYFKSRAFAKVSERAQKDYRKTLALVLDMPSKAGKRFGSYDVKLITAKVVDRVYDRLVSEGRGERYRTANLCVTLLARAWKVVQRLHPKGVPGDNPWRGVIRTNRVEVTKPASRAEAYALSAALKKLGHESLGAIPIICFEWHQRPENVVAHFERDHYRPADRPDFVRIEHHKTGEIVWMPLFNGGTCLFPEAVAYFDGMTWDGRLTTLSDSRVRVLVRKARIQAKLAAHVTLAACRHGGMTELGDAGLTEQGVMSLSGHKTPEASRLYVKRTEKQRVKAASKRREFIGSH
jgi:hypothetical protein